MMWYVLFFLFKQNTSYDVRISDWSSDVCSSDLDLVNNGIYPADKVRREVAITVFFRFTANGISALAVQMHDNEINLLDWCCLPRGDETALLNEMSVQEQHHYRKTSPELRSYYASLISNLDLTTTPVLQTPPISEPFSDPKQSSAAISPTPFPSPPHHPP